MPYLRSCALDDRFEIGPSRQGSERVAMIVTEAHGAKSIRDHGGGMLQ
jgi:hypothetical protein